MHCPVCLAANRGGARFCINCGSALTGTCPNCSQQVPPGAKYCDQCGFHLQAEPVDEPRLESRAPLQQYIPDELLAKLEVARASGGMVGERRVVTLLFCDVKGSTAAAGRLDPEEWADVMNAAFEHLIKPVYRYEGTVARLMGDAILAFFGAPIAHEDDPERAILAGLAILDEIQGFRLEVQRWHGLDFAVRVGINTGLVVAGEIGSDLRMEYTAMGDAVNLAARMEQTAEPMTVQITEHTYRLVAPLFQVDALGEIKVKGKAEPVKAYRVNGRSQLPGRLRGIAGVDLPLIGREDELDILRHALVGLRDGRGGIVCLVGEAGLGKSRLIEELHRLAFDHSTTPGADDQTGLRWTESRALSYESGRPYAQFRQHLASFCGIADADSPQQVREKLARCVEGVGEQPENARTIFEMLFSVDTGSGSSPLEGENFQRRLFSVMLAWWQSWVNEVPGVMVFDDLQWADRASVDLLSHLLRLVETRPMLFVCAFRPERQGPAWDLKQTAERDYPHRFTAISLSPLSAGDSKSLVDNLLPLPDLPPDLRRLILSKSEGNPFFVEEVVRELIESGALEHEVASDGTGQVHWRIVKQVSDIDIPDNLQALMLARIDRLEEQARRTLQLASVIGRNFYYRVLQVISEMSGELDRHLGVLERMEMIRELARTPELEYSFRHALTQEAAYRSMLRKRRRSFHRKVADALETLFPDRTEEMAPILGYHSMESGDPLRAVGHFIKAGDSALRVYAISEALTQYSRALAILEERGELERYEPDALVHLYTRLGRTQELSSQFGKALVTYQEFLWLGERRVERSMVLAAMMALAVVFATPTPVQDPTEARRILESALSLARELEDAVAQSKILWTRMITDVYGAGDLLEARQFGEESLRLARELGLKEQLAFTLNDMWYAYNGTGETTRGEAAMEEARSLWQELGNLPMLSDNLALGHAHFYFTGDFERSISFSDQAYQLSSSIDNHWSMTSSLLFLGQIYLEYGRPDRAVPVMEEAIRLSEEIGHPGAMTGTRADLGWHYALLGDQTRGLELARMAYSRADDLYPLFRQWVLAVLVRLHLLAGDLASAEEAFDLSRGGFSKFSVIPSVPILESLAMGELMAARGDYPQVLELTSGLIEETKETGCRVFDCDAYFLKARALQMLDMSAEAHAALLAARGAAERLESRRALWPILVMLAELEGQRGDIPSQFNLLAQARQIVNYIGEHLADPAMRVAFRSQPAVQTLLGAGE